MLPPQLANSVPALSHRICWTSSVCPLKVALGIGNDKSQSLISLSAAHVANTLSFFHAPSYIIPV